MVSRLALEMNYKRCQLDDKSKPNGEGLFSSPSFLEAQRQKEQGAGEGKMTESNTITHADGPDENLQSYLFPTDFLPVSTALYVLLPVHLLLIGEDPGRHADGESCRTRRFVVLRQRDRPSSEYRTQTLPVVHCRPGRARRWKRGQIEEGTCLPSSIRSD